MFSCVELFAQNGSSSLFERVLIHC